MGVTRSIRAFALAVLACGVVPGAAADDLLNVIVNSANATGGKSIAAFGYDPATDSMYITAFGASGDFGNPAIRKVTNVGGSQVSTSILSEAQLQLYYREGNPDRGVSTPLQSALLLNPLPVGGRPAFSFAIIADNGFTRFPSSTTTDPSVTKRFYEYSLQAPPPGGDGRDVFTTRVTLADMQAVVTTTNTSSNQGRQFAWSGDGQSIYFLDSSTVFGGIWKVPAAGGNPVRILADSTLGVSELTVVRAGGVDRIYFRGSEVTGNPGGIDFITHNGTTTGPLQAAVSTATLNAFLELSSGDTGVAAASLSADADGNIYFNNTDSSPERRGLFRLDPQGRLVKVVSRAERLAAFGGSPNANMLRQQPRTVMFNGLEGSFPVTQILYAENHINSVAGVNVFKPGDFNRDNTLDADDTDLFKAVLTVRGIVQTDAAKLKFDGNGNSVVDWKDVKIFQQFFDFGDGDADLNGLVDFGDFRVLRDHFGQSGRVFTQGDLDGDDDVDALDFQILQGGFDYRSSIYGAGVVAVPFNQAEWDAFVSSIPEPGALGYLAVAGAVVLRRRRSLKTAN